MAYLPGDTEYHDTTTKLGSHDRLTQL